MWSFFFLSGNQAKIMINIYYYNIILLAQQLYNAFKTYSWFVCYLMTYKLQRFIINEWGPKKESWPVSIYYPIIYLEELRRNHETPQKDSWYENQDSS